jgi:hypothetical protein
MQAMKRVLKLLEAFDIDRTRARSELPAKRLRSAMGKLRDYIHGQSAHLVNYGLRQRQGLAIGTSTTEGLANALVNKRMNKLQQMRWSAKGGPCRHHRPRPSFQRTRRRSRGATSSRLTPRFEPLPVTFGAEIAGRPETRHSRSD